MTDSRNHWRQANTQNPRTPRAFYEEQYEGEGYRTFDDTSQHGEYERLSAFIRSFGLDSGHALEVGCGRGAFQDLVADCTCVDIAVSAAKFIHKKFVVASATSLPFPDNCFDCVWSVMTLEHVPEPEKALGEFRRVAKPGGYVYLSPAWQCRPWTANGYNVRPYKELDLRGKIIKLSIPVRNNLVFRSLHVVTKRLVHHLAWVIVGLPTRFWYRQLRPNYAKFWTV